MYIDRKIGDFVVEQRQNDGYINATKLTKAYERKTGTRKNATKWFENDRTIQYIELLSDKTKLDVHDLVQKKGSGRDIETWIHPKLAVSFSMWLSPEFEMIVAEWVEEWLTTGKTPIYETVQLHPYQRVWYQRLTLFEQNTKLPRGKWCIFEQIAGLMRDLEAEGVVLPENATIDVSVGRTWCHWLREQGHNTDEFEQYIHHYPDRRGEKFANVYSFNLLGEFHQWLQDTYIPGKFPKYVREFCTPDECKLISDALGCEVKPIQKRLKANQS